MEIINKDNYPYLYSDLKIIKKRMNLKDVPIKIYKDKTRYNGKAKIGGIYLSEALVLDYKKHPHVVKFLAAHELVHYKNKEYGINTLHHLLGLISNHYKAVRLLEEMRANLNGFYYAGLTTSEKIESQEIIQNKNDSSQRTSSYKVGYPDRELIKQMGQQFNCFNKTAAEIIVGDFCEEMKIQDPENFNYNVVSRFFK